MKLCLISFTFPLFINQSIRARVPDLLPLPTDSTRGDQTLLFRRKISDSNSHPKVVQDIHDLSGCPGEICGTLAGDSIQPLLAGASECAQQDMADKMIDIAKSKLQDKAVQKNLIELARLYRQAERNTFPDYSSPSMPDRNSLYCQKSPKNSELLGLFQKQSPTADPKLFFDPKANGKSVLKGSDPRTEPFGEGKGKPRQAIIATKSTKVNDDDIDNEEDDVDVDEGKQDNLINLSDETKKSPRTSRNATQVKQDQDLGIVQSGSAKLLAPTDQSAQTSTDNKTKKASSGQRKGCAPKSRPKV